MALKIVVIGATGIVGRTLVPLLREAGHHVVATTAAGSGEAALDEMGIEPLVADLFDADGLVGAVVSAAPDVIIHQVTDLAPSHARLSRMDRLTRNARIRREGAANVARAARASGTARLVAQSIAWMYAPKQLPYVESDPLDSAAAGPRSISVREGIAPAEQVVLSDTAFEGIVLRYGQIYGPGTWSMTPTGPVPVHVDAAAHAALLAVHHGRTGAYNIADPGCEVSTERASRELGWRHDYRRK